MTLAFFENGFLWLMIYSVFGWVYESVYCSIVQKKFVNRGFLNGPYCPIYGCGALLVLTVLGRVTNPALLFLLGMLLTCGLEYLTSYGMEKLFHARWWDYSEMRFNLNGRICLLGALVFGAFSVLIVKVIHPAVSSCTDRIPPVALHVVTAVLLAAALADIAVTCVGFAGFNEKLRLLTEELRKHREKTGERVQSYRQTVTDRLRETDVYQSVAATYAELSKRFNFQERRMLNAFPKLRSLRYDDALSELRQRLRRFHEERKHRER